VVIDLTLVGGVLLAFNILWRHFDPFVPLWRRTIKFVLILLCTAAVSRFFGHRGIAIAAALWLVPLLYVHAWYLPRHGVNGWTGEPRERYYALRGWNSEGSRREKGGE
jgi:hypothetical protein